MPALSGESVWAVPELELTGDAVLSNFDHSIDRSVAGRLREGGGWSRHAAWEFNGRVWFADGQWHECVWCYGEPREVFSAATLEDLMRTVNDVWGWK